MLKKIPLGKNAFLNIILVKKNHGTWALEAFDYGGSVAKETLGIDNRNFMTEKFCNSFYWLI